MFDPAHFYNFKELFSDFIIIVTATETLREENAIYV